MLKNILATVLVIGSATVVHAKDLHCGGDYTISRGDSLWSIANRVEEYPGQDMSLKIGLIKAHNASLTSDNSVILPGNQIFLPCMGNEANAPVEGTTTEELIKIGGPVDISFLTASDYPPFSDEDYEMGGMFPKIIDQAFSRQTELTHRVTFVNDWSAHLKPLLLQQGAFDAAFPWFRPNCESPATLDADGKLRCRYFHFSEPVYSVAVQYYSLTETPRVTSFEELTDKTICRPAGYFGFDFAEKGLVSVDPNGTSTATIVRATSPEACFELMLSGDADLVSVNLLLGEAMNRRPQFAGRFVANPALSYDLTLHVIFPKHIPESSVTLHRFNQLLGQLKAENELDQIKQDYMRAFYFLDG